MKRKGNFIKIGLHGQQGGVVYQCEKCEYTFVVFFIDQLEHKEDTGCPRCNLRKKRGY